MGPPSPICFSSQMTQERRDLEATSWRLHAGQRFGGSIVEVASQPWIWMRCLGFSWQSWHKNLDIQEIHRQATATTTTFGLRGLHRCPRLCNPGRLEKKLQVNYHNIWLSSSLNSGSIIDTL
nr:uncharacterized protein LOC127326886 [Lolium perenne]